MRAVYKGLYANHRSEGRTRLQRTVLRPFPHLRLQETLAARAGGCARASRHRRDGSTAESPIEPDLRVMAGTALAAAPIESILGPRTTRSAVVRRTLGPLAGEVAFAQWRCHDRACAESPTEPDFRVRARRTRAPSFCGQSAHIVLAPSRNATPRRPSGARKRTADGSAHTAHRCAFSALQRLADSALIALASMNRRIAWSTPNSTSQRERQNALS